MRELAIAGARHLVAAPLDKAKRQTLLEELADDFRKPETAPWEELREGKARAWPIR